MELTFLFFLLTLAMGLAAWTVFWWTVRSGQLKEPEAPAAEMLENDARDLAGPITGDAR